jgi:hypothetical protein
MVDPAGDPSSAPSAPRCPWCSAELPANDVKTCPSCKANLTAETDAQVPGLTALDLERLAFRRATAPKKSRLMSWISGDSDYENASDPVAQPGSLDPPPFEVRREMLRIEMAALIADLTAEAGAMASDEAAAHGSDPVAAAAAVQAEIDAVTRAEQVLADTAETAAPVEAPAQAPPTDVVTEVVAKPAGTRRLGRRPKPPAALEPAETTPPAEAATPGEPGDPSEASEGSRPDPSTEPETAPS